MKEQLKMMENFSNGMPAAAQNSSLPVRYLNPPAPASVRGSVRGYARDSVRDSVRGSARGSVNGSVRGYGRDYVRDSVRGSARGSVRDSVRDSIRGSVRDVPVNSFFRDQIPLENPIHSASGSKMSGSDEHHKSRRGSVKGNEHNKPRHPSVGRSADK